MPFKQQNRRQSVFPSDILGGLKISIGGGAVIGGGGGAGGKRLIAAYQNTGDQICNYPAGSPTTQHTVNLDTVVMMSPNVSGTSPFTYTADTDSILGVEIFLEYELEAGLFGIVLTPKTGTNSSKRDASFPSIGGISRGGGLLATYWIGEVFCAENDELQVGITAYNNTTTPKNLTVKACELYVYRS